LRSKTWNKPLYNHALHKYEKRLPFIQQGGMSMGSHKKIERKKELDRRRRRRSKRLKQRIQEAKEQANKS
jgi:hypothetical protein